MQYFTEKETWLGGYYELAIELDPCSDGQLLSALIAIWSDPDIDGVYLSREMEPSEQPRHAVTNELLQFGYLQGLASLPNRSIVACGTCIIREENISDWLVLYLPMGALEKAYHVGGYPFDYDVTSSREWSEALDTWFVKIGIRLYDHVKFRLGLVGFEVSGDLYADEIARNGIPSLHYAGIPWPTNGIITYHPSTE
jgi:hypothetical protein